MWGYFPQHKDSITPPLIHFPPPYNGVSIHYSGGVSLSKLFLLDNFLPGNFESAMKNLRYY